MAKKKQEEVKVQEQAEAQEQYTLGDAIVAAAVDLVAKREFAAAAARQNNLGPGGLNEAMKAVGKAEGVFTEAVLALRAEEAMDPDE